MKGKSKLTTKAKKPEPPTSSPPRPMLPERTNSLTATLTCICGAVVQHDFPWAFGAFEETRSVLCSIPCPTCSTRNYTSVKHYCPPIDEEILTVWSRYNDVCFSSQDEDLLLANITYLPWLVQLFDHPETLPSKRGDIIAALMTLAYNSTWIPARPWNETERTFYAEIQAQAIAALKPRLPKGYLDDNRHWGYIAAVVYPFLLDEIAEAS